MSGKYDHVDSGLMLVQAWPASVPAPFIKRRRAPLEETSSPSSSSSPPPAAPSAAAAAAAADHGGAMSSRDRDAAGGGREPRVTVHRLPQPPPSAEPTSEGRERPPVAGAPPADLGATAADCGADEVCRARTRVSRG